MPLRHRLARRILFFTSFVAVLCTAPFVRADNYTFRWANPTPQGNALRAVAYEDNLVGYAVGDRGTTLRTTDGGTTWVDLTRYPQFVTDLHDVMALGTGELLAVGATPGIFHSSDGGASWTPVTNPSSAVLLDVDIVTGNTLSAIGDNGQVLRSTDRGATWSLRPTPWSGRLLDQFWKSATDGYVTGEFHCRHTIDGGLTWTLLSGIPDGSFNFFTGVHFLDAMNGWILEHFTTYRTTDGGATWFPKHGSLPSSPFYQEDLVVLDASHRFVVTLLEGAGIWETFDDGLTWTNRYLRNNTQGYGDLDRRADGALVAVSTFGDLLRSTDGGITWTNATHSPSDADRSHLQAMNFSPGGHGFAGGRDGSWLESHDSGLSWQIPATTPGVFTANDIVFFDDNLVFAGGYQPPGQSRIMRSTNGGATWTSHPLSASYVGYPQSIAVPTASTCYTVTNGGTGINFVFRSTDGGQTWSSASTGVSSTNPLQSVFFLDASVGFVGGGDFSSDAQIWKTTNGAASWTPVGEAGLAQNRIEAMWWWTPSIGLVANYTGVFRTTNGGASWTQVLSGGTFDLDFRDARNGIAGSYFYNYVSVTADSGNTWTRVDLPWTGAPEAAVSVPGGFYLAGDGSVILQGVETGATSVEVAAPGERDRLPAVRVTPNPTTGVIELGLTSIRAGIADVRIIDIRGREVDATKRPVTVGTSSIGWDGSARAPGVYFADVRLPDGERRSVRFLIAR